MTALGFWVFEPLLASQPEAVRDVGSPRKAILIVYSSCLKVGRIFSLEKIAIPKDLDFTLRLSY